MARRATPALAAVLLLTAFPDASAASGTAVPLRSLTYAVDVSTAAEVDTAGSGLRAPARLPQGGYVAGSITATGTGESHSAATQQASGTITIDVLQATSDAALVVDIAETTDVVTRPKVRITIARNGALFFKRTDAANLSDEEVVVARWLDRGFYGERPTEVGTAWTVDLSENGNSNVERYRVVSHDEHAVTLSYSFEERTKVSRSYAGTRDGSLVYDPAMEVPVKAAYEAIARRQLGDSFDTVRMAVKLSLRTDSFTKSPAR